MDHQFVFLSKQTNKLVSAEQVNVWCFIRYSGRTIKRLPDLIALSGIILNYPFFYKWSQRFGTKIQLVFVPFLLQLFSLASNAVSEPLHEQNLYHAVIVRMSWASYALVLQAGCQCLRTLAKCWLDLIRLSNFLCFQNLQKLFKPI